MGLAENYIRERCPEHVQELETIANALVQIPAEKVKVMPTRKIIAGSHHCQWMVQPITKKSISVFSDMH